MCVVRQASLGAESLELLEEAKAIKAAQRKAQKAAATNLEKAAEVTKAQGKAAAGSKGAAGSSKRNEATEGPLGAGSCAHRRRVLVRDGLGQCAQVRSLLLACVRCGRRDRRWIGSALGLLKVL